MKWQLWWMSKGQSSILIKLLLLMLSWNLLPTINLFFIYAAGGCGKTFLCNTIAAEVRRRGQVALCVASSGIAALCWMEEEHLTHTLKFLFLSMKTLWLGSNTIVTCSQSSNKPRLLFGMKFLCSISMILMLLINVSETCLK